MRSPLAVMLAAGLALTACGEPEPAGGALPPPSDVSTPSTDVASTTAPPTTIPLTTTDGGATVGSNGPFDPSAVMRPDLMVIEPPVVGYGDPVTVTYPEGRERGVAYVLEWSLDGDWHTTHYLTATTDGYGTEPRWAPYGTEVYGWEAIGISGPGPDSLVIPDSALAGDYRICTANSLANICTPVTVVKPDESPTDDPEASSVLGDGTSDPVTALLGLPLGEFEQAIVGLVRGPVRVAWRNGEHQEVTDDLVPGRVNVAVETRDGVDIVIDARVETDPDTSVAGPEATVVGVYDGVEFYPACGNEQLEHDGVVWYQVQSYEYPEVYDRAVNGYREQAPESVTVHGLAPRVAAPGPGDDIGTLVVWSDDVAYFVSDSGDLHTWLVRDELLYDWVC